MSFNKPTARLAKRKPETYIENKHIKRSNIEIKPKITKFKYNVGSFLEEKLLPLTAPYYKPVIAVGAMAALGMAAPEIAIASGIGITMQTIASKLDNQALTWIPAIVTNNPAAIATSYGIQVLQNAPEILTQKINASSKRIDKDQLTLTKQFLEASYDKKDAQQSLFKSGYILDDKLSNYHTKTYVKDGKASIIHRGSVDTQDWIDDAMILLGKGKQTKRYDEVLNITNKVEKKYGKSDSYGHSYGGWLAQESKNSGNTYTFNKHSFGINEVFKTIDKKETDYYKGGDLASLVASWTQTGGNKVWTGNKNVYINPLDAHTIIN